MAVKNGRNFNWRNFWLVFSISLGQLAFGYPASIIGTTLGEPSFLIYMGFLDPETEELTKNANALIGAMSGVFQAGAFINAFIVSYIIDRWGRKMSFVYNSALSIFGGALLVGSINPAMFIVARLFAGMGSWGYLCATPIYSAELAPPDVRGIMVGMNGVMIALGYGLASYMGTAFYYAHSDAAKWRGPLGLALVWPILMLFVCWFAPESPRWLLSKGRVDEARDIVMRIHATPGDEDQEYARGEFYQMLKQTELEKMKHVTWWDMFRKPSYRRRTFTAMGFAFVGQSTAVLVINNYGPTLYKALGYGTEDQLRLQCGWISIGVISNFIGALVMDRFGRRPLMIGAVAGCCICLIIEAAMVASFAAAGTNKAGLGVGVAAFMIFLFIYGLGIDCAGVVFYSEIFPNHMRHKGVALSIAVIALTDLVYLQATTTAFANIGWKFYLVFIIISGLGTIVAYFYIPETKGVPLEEIAKIFGDTEDVAVYAQDIHVDLRTHELVVGDHHDPNSLAHVATEPGKVQTEHIEVTDSEKQV